MLLQKRIFASFVPPPLPSSTQVNTSHKTTAGTNISIQLLRQQPHLQKRAGRSRGDVATGAASKAVTPAALQRQGSDGRDAAAVHVAVGGCRRDVKAQRWFGPQRLPPQSTGAVGEAVGSTSPLAAGQWWRGRGSHPCGCPGSGLAAGPTSLQRQGREVGGAAAVSAAVWQRDGVRDGRPRTPAVPGRQQQGRACCPSRHLATGPQG